MKIKRNFDYFSCLLEGRQLCIGETGLLPAKEVVRAVCEAGFQNNNMFVFENALPPKDGMYLLKVTRKADELSRLVFVDTRTNPDYIWVEKKNDDENDGTTWQFAKAVESAIRIKACDYGWNVKVREFVFSRPKDIPLLCSAVEYVDSYGEETMILDKSAFRAIVIADIIADEVMALIMFYMKGKDTPNALIEPLRAAKDAGAITKMTKAIFKKIFGDILGNSISAVDKYMSQAYKGYYGVTFDEMKAQFAVLVAKSRLYV